MANPSAFIQSENIRLKEDNRRLSEEVDSLREFVSALDRLYTQADALQDDSQLQPFLRDVLVRAMKILNAPDGSLLLVDDDTQELVFLITLGALEQQLTGHRIPLDEGIAGWVARNGKAALVSNVRTDPRFSNTVDKGFMFNTQSIAAAPLLGGKQVLGVIELLNQRGDEPFSDFDLSLLQIVCRSAGQALMMVMNG